MKLIRKISTRLLLLTFIVISGISCKSDDQYLLSPDDETNALAELKFFEIQSGENRVLVKGVIDDENISEVKITWDAGALSIPVNATSTPDTINALIENLEERLYTFEVQTFSNTGESSKILKGAAAVFGEEFKNNALNRELISGLLLDNKLDLEYGPTAASSGIIGTEITYINLDGDTEDVYLDAKLNTISIPDYKNKSVLKYRSAYRPTPTAIDTIYSNYTETSFAAPPVIYFIANGANDNVQIEWLRTNGFIVSTKYDHSRFDPNDQSKIDELNGADLVIIGRSGSSGNFNGTSKTAWNSLTVPLILNSQWISRNSRINWFNQASDPVPFTTSSVVMKAKIEDPTDAVFQNVTLENNDLLSWLSTPINLLYTATQTNGKVMVTSAPGEANNDEGGAMLYVRFEPNVEFYEGAGESPAGPRTYFGFGADSGGSFYFQLTDEAKQVYLNEIKRLIDLKN
ncbi:DUF4998 domain-containing protein [Leeuwenhoekiella sp. W20_SRS_FM14]|uniref:DUF4998 domain-containing protein n=1 Tax=Leeuwenhoekiella sp. W20_SRS_FM14 TaxID=3240270 RepID=UPI003F9B9EF6